MKEKANDGGSFTGKSVAEGWHIVEVMEPIEYVKNKDGEEVQDKSGAKIWKIPIQVKDDKDESNGGNIGCSVFESNGGALMATILEAAGLWGAICKAFPGDDVTVFDKKIMDGVKTKLPGRSFMVESITDKNGYAKLKSVASFTKYKEIEKDKKGGKKEEPAKESAASGTGDGW
jgi:hypothetical protein